MANTYTQLHIQLVFAVKGRECLIAKSNKEELHKYITGVIQNDGHKMLAVNCMPDHTHIFLGLNPAMALSDLVHKVKIATGNLITDNNWVENQFHWQKGFGAFSYAKSQVEKVVKYVLNQEEHHRTKTFKEEYLNFLKKFEIEFNEKYLFEWIE